MDAILDASGWKRMEKRLRLVREKRPDLVTGTLPLQVYSYGILRLAEELLKSPPRWRN